jgi:hypothetical protein
MRSPPQPALQTRFHDGGARRGAYLTRTDWAAAPGGTIASSESLARFDLAFILGDQSDRPAK